MSKLTLERRVNEDAWKEISVVSNNPNSGKIICVDTDTCESVLDQKLSNKAVKIQYRLKIVDQKGKISYSNSIYYDFWWKKLYSYYYSVNSSNNHINEIYSLVDKIVRIIVKRHFYSTALKLNIEAEYLIEEVRQDIFERLINNKNRTENNFNNFWSYVANSAKNRIISIFRAKRSGSIENIDVDLISVDSPESDFISLEKRDLIRKEFYNLFHVYLVELWEQNPTYALTLQFWLQIRLSLTKESLSFIFSAIMDNNNSTGEEIEEGENSYCVFKKILSDLRNLKDKNGKYDSTFEQIPYEKRDDFNRAIDELFLDEKKAETRLRQWWYRGITVVRTKMLPVLNSLKDI